MNRGVGVKPFREQLSAVTKGKNNLKVIQPFNQIHIIKSTFVLFF
jgi:hypothetical protein